jgi:membrane protein
VISPGFEAWLEKPSSELSPWMRPVRYTLRLAVRAVQQLIRDRAPLMAAAITYRTVFALVPVLVVSLVVLRFFLGTNAISDGVNALLDQLGLTDLAIDTLNEPAAEAQGDEPADASGPLEDTEGPQDVAQWIETLVQRVEGVNFGAIGAVGAAILVYASISLLVQVEQCFNIIYAAPSGRKITTRLTTYWTMLTLGPIGIISSLTLGSRLGEIVRPEQWGSGIFDSLLSLGISWLILTAAYTLIPNARVKLRPAALGAIIAAVLFEIGKHAFRSYLGFSTGYARLYGSLGLVPVFFLWVYITWLIVLFGLEISRALQTMSDHHHTDPAADPPADPVCALAMLVEAARRFDDGRPLLLSEAASAAGLTPRHAEDVFKKLADRGYVHAVETEEDEPRFVLAREPHRIQTADVARAIGPGAEAPASELRSVLIDRHENLNLEELAEQAREREKQMHEASEGNGTTQRTDAPAGDRRGD